MQRVLDQLRATVADLVSLVGSSPPASFRRRPPGAGDWDGATILGHLADAEMVYAVRVRTILTSDDPLLPSYDQDAWAERFGPYEDGPAASLTRFRVLRESTITILESLTDSEWARAGLHEERGTTSVADIARLLVDHDREHLDQLRRALAR